MPRVGSYDVQRLFLHAILSRAIVPEGLAKLLWKKSIEAVHAVDATLELPDPDSDDAWYNFIAKVNKSLDELHLDFRRVEDESTGKPVYILVNAKSDEISQLATDYNPAEIAYFRALVEQIILAPRHSFSISSLGALRELSSIKPKSNMTKTQAETVLASFVARGWLRKSTRGRYSLSTRSVVELGPYLKTTFPEDIVECSACNKIMTQGMACSTGCDHRLHYHCFANFRKRHSTCPQCGKDWPPNAKDKPLVPIGEDAARNGDDVRRRVRIRSPEPSDNEMEEDPSQTQTQTQQPTQRDQRAKATRKQDKSVDVDDEEEGDVSTKKPKRIVTRQARRGGRW
ncbi:hypothetical protein M378DRAFT_184086 [Amanita muscaria Koide BX008]|uniref:Non-structural maintenance of chromosomes element 1 homolog n=1 Tax=Amanita muscaria (strain Koide BX008) TaxID=946122 RepID=A0A0C2XJL9_AMAMK|nr:hypothetical protein M378DRAFT_184086 [Amanita muscaria Koide BX008]